MCHPTSLSTPSLSSWDYGHKSLLTFLPLLWAEEAENLARGLFPPMWPCFSGGKNLVKGCIASAQVLDLLTLGLWGQCKGCRSGLGSRTGGQPGLLVAKESHRVPGWAYRPGSLKHQPGPWEILCELPWRNSWSWLKKVFLKTCLRSLLSCHRFISRHLCVCFLLPPSRCSLSCDCLAFSGIQLLFITSVLYPEADIFIYFSIVISILGSKRK